MKRIKGKVSIGLDLLKIEIENCYVWGIQHFFLLLERTRKKFVIEGEENLE